MRIAPTSSSARSASLALLLLVAGACEDDATRNADPCADPVTCRATPSCAPTCETSLLDFRSRYEECEPDYASAQNKYLNQPGECRTAFYDCDGLHAFVLSYATDNVQCYYGNDGSLVGAISTSDHGHPLQAGTVPSSYCDPRPRCDSPDAGG
jgi:hypothetical protein